MGNQVPSYAKSYAMEQLGVPSGLLTEENLFGTSLNPPNSQKSRRKSSNGSNKYKSSTSKTSTNSGTHTPRGADGVDSTGGPGSDRSKNAGVNGKSEKSAAKYTRGLGKKPDDGKSRSCLQDRNCCSENSCCQRSCIQPLFGDLSSQEGIMRMGLWTLRMGFPLLGWFFFVALGTTEYLKHTVSIHFSSIRLGIQ